MNYSVWEGRPHGKQQGQDLFLFDLVIKENLTLEQAEEIEKKLTEEGRTVKIVDKVGINEYIMITEV